MTRFEGPSGSGKTTASKLISTLLYGSPQHKKATDAANYTDGSQNPLIALDNIEARQMTEELTTFMLTSITGIAKEKRKSGTDTETVIERTKCLLNSTGIEPLGGELAEVLSRSFIIRFDMDEQASDCFLEATVLAAIGEHRDYIAGETLALDFAVGEVGGNPLEAIIDGKALALALEVVALAGDATAQGAI